MLWKGRKVKDSYYLMEASSVEGLPTDGLSIIGAFVGLNRPN